MRRGCSSIVLDWKSIPNETSRDLPWSQRVLRTSGLRSLPRRRRKAIMRLRAARFRLTFALLFFACLVAPASAGPAVRFIVSNDPCVIQICPATHAVPPKIVEAGKSFQVYVSAQDANNSVDKAYVGPVVVASTDPLAVLPLNLSFLPADQGRKEFGAVLMTLGDQTITVTDPVRGITGSLTMTVTAPAIATVPILSDLSKLLLIGALAVAGIWLARSRH